MVSQANGSAALLGGGKAFQRAALVPMAAHALIVAGLPGAALLALIDNVELMRDEDSLEKAVGISLRTVQRKRADTSDKRLSLEQGGRTWKFAQILARATGVFGTQADAEDWLSRPAMALDQQRPIDLLATPAGVEIVETFLEQLEFGVYA